MANQDTVDQLTESVTSTTTDLTAAHDEIQAKIDALPDLTQLHDSIAGLGTAADQLEKFAALASPKTEAPTSDPQPEPVVDASAEQPLEPDPLPQA